MASTWQNGLFSCVGDPGGVGTCVRGCFCPCCALADIHEYNGGLGGWNCGCFLSGAGLLVGIPPWWLLAPWNHPNAIAEKSGFQEECLPMCGKCLCCSSCYICQVHNEMSLQKMKRE